MPILISLDGRLISLDGRLISLDGRLMKIHGYYFLVNPNIYPKEFFFSEVLCNKESKILT